MNPSRRELARWLLAAAAGRALLRSRPALAQVAAANARLGINIAGPTYYNSELPFVDLFRMSRDWEVKRTDGTKPPAPLLADLDSNGWIASLAAGTWAETPLAVLGRVPTGIWTVLYEGSGRLEMWGALKVVSEESGRIRFRVDPHAQARIWLRLWQTDPANHVRAIRVLMPGAEETYRTQPWNPSFLKRWQGMAALRFMDLMVTNNSRAARWSDRPRPEHATFSGRGVALELLIDLANRLQCDAWFCMPHLADDDYVRRFASLVRDRLAPERRVYVEYSNEVWNRIFEQHAEALRRGRQLGLPGGDLECALRFAALRATQMFRLWEETFGRSQRLIPVIASQAVSAWTAETMLSVDGAAATARAVAIAPYVGLVASPVGKPPAAEISLWSLDQVFQALQPELVKYDDAVRRYRELADRYRLKLVAYEGGQHLVGVHGAENDERLTALFHAANRDPRMGEVYRRMYQIWEAGGGDLFCHFSSVNPNNKWGSWGLLEYHDDDPARSPKFVETFRWASARGQYVNLPK